MADHIPGGHLSMLPTVTHTGPGRPCLGVVGWGTGGGRMGVGGIEQWLSPHPPTNPTQISHKQLSGGEVRALPRYLFHALELSGRPFIWTNPPPNLPPPSDSWLTARGRQETRCGGERGLICWARWCSGIWVKALPLLLSWGG